MPKESKESLEFDAYRIDAEQRLLISGDSPIPLAPKVFDTLLVLVESGGCIVEKGELLKRVWPDTFVEEGSLARNISTLRKALGENPDDQRYIQTIPKRGYRFIPPVRTVPKQAVLGRPAGAHRVAVAVVPFLLRTPLAEDEFLSVALADAVIHRLDSSGNLLVRPTVSVMRYAGREADWKEVARELNVDLVVDGTIQRMGPKIRVLVRVHRVWDALLLYSSKLDADADDLFGLEDRLSEGVRGALLPPSQAERKNGSFARKVNPKTTSPIAYELFLRAAERVTRLNKWDTQSAIEMLMRATGVDPSFTEAWARLSQACVQMSVAFDSDPRWFQMAENAVRMTLALDMGNADALCARGQMLWSPHHSYQNRQALRALNGALKMNSGCHAARIWRGLILFHLGLYDEAREGLEEARSTNPDDTRTLVFLGQTALYRGDCEEARELNGRALAADPASIWPNIFYPIILLYLGRPAEAIERIRIARAMLPEEPTLLSLEGLVAAHEGEFHKAERMADEALTHTQSLLHTHHLWHNAAGVFAMCGKPEKAVPLLRRCAQMGLPNHLLFESDPHLNSLRRQPGFLELMSELRVEHEQYRAEFGSASS
jgi:DNA-binding winged helix-turn-helix (wHTH) protein/Flp pilus assembly protein TadD